MHRLELSTSLRLFCVLSLAPLVGACSDDQAGADQGGVTTQMSGTATGTDTASEEEAETDTSDDTTDPGTDSASFVSEEGPGTDTDAPLGNLGDPCMSDSECAEDLFCNGIPALGGICSECGSDADCPDNSNCTIGASGWFACGDGSIGQMCEADSSCAEDLYCAELLDLGGLFMANFCSECADDSQCENGQLCVPQLDFMDIMNLSGQRACVDPGTHPQDSLCDHAANGDEQCEGLCTVASLMGLIELGICGQCESDEDCMDGTCSAATVGLEGIAGSMCM